ncbi:PRC-barrel domain-containing protein [Longispora sp. NPDC051575]|uniref:PRC-barrel domain-containing protein n=1 Tax=Longispora sp. NPDC051575 TaxID=3154943 RepID=UPI003430599A
MTLLVRASDLVKRPVVTLAGEDVAQVKDVVFDGSSGEVSGFTLNGRGVFAGPLRVALPIAAVTAIGGDAVMITDEAVLVERGDVAHATDLAERDVLGDRVLTDTGVDLGTVVDVILQVGAATDVVGYEVKTAPALHHAGRRVLIPLPDTLSVSGEALIVPARAVEFVAQDLAGFGAAIEAFRTQLRGDGDAVQ